MADFQKCLDIVKSLYPDFGTRTYSVPPVNFNRVSYVQKVAPGTSQPILVLHPPSDGAPIHEVLPTAQSTVPLPQHSLWPEHSDKKPKRVQQSDSCDDFAQTHVLLNLQEFGESRKEAMFIVSQLQFGHYLNQKAYAAAVAAANLQTKANLRKQDQQGDFDFLLINRRSGILAGELKSVGRQNAPSDDIVAQKVQKALSQLDKSERVLQKLLSDLPTAPSVKKSMFLPYINMARLQNVIDARPSLQKAMYKTLGASCTADAVKMCCCSDQLSDPASYSNISEDVLSKIETWWKFRMPCASGDQFTEELYLDIVARFVGPASTVAVHSYDGVHAEIRTIGEAVSELGRRVTYLVLTPEQLTVMHKNKRIVCITGPPGTGKTVMLVLQGLRWLLEGQDVQVISTNEIGLVISKVIDEQLNLTLKMQPQRSPPPGKVHFSAYDFPSGDDELKRAIDKLTKSVKDGRLNLLFDEVIFSSSDMESKHNKRLIEILDEKVQDFHCWAACIFHEDIPQQFESMSFTTPLRSTPAVVKEVQRSISRIPGEILNYSNTNVPSPGDGLPVTRMSHEGRHHQGRWPVDCTRCGKKVADKLKRLGVGTTGRRRNAPPPLKYRDVFVLTRSSELHDESIDEAGELNPASGLVCGLREAGFPVSVLGCDEWEQDVEKHVREIALAKKDVIYVARYGYVTGIERRIVVVVPGMRINTDTDDEDGLWNITLSDKLVAASRCTTHLIVVRMPTKNKTKTKTNADSCSTVVPCVLPHVLQAATSDTSSATVTTTVTADLTQTTADESNDFATTTGTVAMNSSITPQNSTYSTGTTGTTPFQFPPTDVSDITPSTPQ